MVKKNKTDSPSGGGGIRTHGTFRYTGFRDRHFRPLSHPSEKLTHSRGRTFWIEKNPREDPRIHPLGPHHVPSRDD